jgi:hypothetical protein
MPKSSGARKTYRLQAIHIHTHADTIPQTYLTKEREINLELPCGSSAGHLTMIYQLSVTRL